MAKHTTSNVNQSPFQLMLNALDNSTNHRERMERSEAAAFFNSIRACSDPATLEEFTRLYTGLKDSDEKQRTMNRNIFAEKFGVNKFIEGDGDDAKRGQNYRNRMTRTVAVVGFGVNFHALGFWPDLTIESDGRLVSAKGGSQLVAKIWQVLEWNNQKRFDGKRSQSMPVIIQQRAGERSLGEISWANLAMICAKLRGEENANNVRRAVTLSPSKPIDALQKIAKLVADNKVEANFTNASSRLTAIDTAEDILALALKGNSVEAKYKKQFDNLFQELRDIYQAKMHTEQSKDGRARESEQAAA